MANENNLPRKPSFFKRLIHPRAFEEYLTRQLEEKGEQLEAAQQQLEEFTGARELGLTVENLRSWQANLVDKQSQLDTATEKNAELRNALLAQQREQEEMARALKTWQETLLGIQNMSDPEKVQTIARLRQEIEDTKNSSEKRAESLQDVLRTLVEEVIPDKDNIISELERTNYGLTGQIKEIQGERDAAQTLADTERQRAEAAKKDKEAVTNRLEGVLGAYKNAGIINDVKDEEALTLENKFRNDLIGYAEEYRTEKSTLERYNINPSDDRHKENKAKYIASCLGALAAYSDMDSRTDLNTEIRVAIVNAARDEAKNYASNTQDNMNSRRFMGWFADAFFKNRVEPKYINNTNLEEFRDDFILNNYSPYRNEPFCQPTIEVLLRYQFMYNQEHSYSPDLLGILNEDKIYGEAGGPQVGTGDER